MRVILSDLYLAKVYSQTFQLFNWTRCAVLYGDEVWGAGVYSMFVSEAERLGIEIVNEES
jgi:hypothetical protein